MTNATDYLAMDRRSFGEVVDAYIKEAHAATPLTSEERSILESEPVLSRLFLHLRGVRESIKVQVKSDEVALEFDLASARARDASDKECEKIKAEAYKGMRGRLRFATGLNAALQHVTWLYSHNVHVALEDERNDLIVRESAVAEALETHRRAALDDDEGTLDREEDLWKDQAIIDLIGITPEEDPEDD